MNLIKKSGSWYEYNGQKIAQGRDSAKEYWKENPKVTESLYQEIKKLVLSGKESIPLEIAVEEDQDDSEGIDE
jgi:recombination protein RecA